MVLVQEMKRPHFAHILRSFAISIVILASAGVSFGQSQWTSIRSANFSVVGNAQEREIRRVTTKLEQFREVFTRLFPNLKFSSPVPTTVIVFRNEKAFRPYKPLGPDGAPSEWAAGYFHSGDDFNYIVLSTERERQATYQTIFHEYVHFLISNSFRRSRIPPWFGEGLAEYYDQFAIEGDIRVFLGNVNSSHVNTLQRSTLIPLDTFFRIDHYSLNQQGSHGANIYYAQAWALMHYMFHGPGGDRSKQVDAFMRALLQGEDDEEAFRRSFQMDFAEMERELRRYIDRRTFLRTQITFKEKLSFDDQMVAAPLPESEAKAILGDLLLSAGRLDEAEAHLNEALAGNADSQLANSSMAMVKMRQRKFDEARALLDRILRSGKADYLAHYRFAFVLSREGMHENGWVTNYRDEVARQMRALLRRSIELNPSFPESYRLLAFISIVRNDEIDESIGHIRKALSLSPGNEIYQLDLASLYLRKEEFDTASAIAKSIFESAKEPSVRSHAQGILRNLETAKRVAAQNRRLREAQERTGGIPVVIEYGEDLPTPEVTAEMRARVEMIGLNEALRKTRDGETRVLGYLKKIECARGAISYHVEADGKKITLQSKDFQGLELVALTPVSGLEIGCSSVNRDLFTVLTYVPNPDPRSKTHGTLISIELVPDHFRFLEQ
jgi:tetratricopeptide (TPR) repeat protein